ncbi:MAG: DUF4331 domain-containing protein [Deltaproteobacteria bacterium]|nr:DUF4331 domain-containing protein [Sandaracinaceae bacterium]MCX7808423.1 DUF4331 domain-containing protein [Deltaproteobacteria bacterium]MDW8246548.1 DUF4331 family protein [Sandaracinaceae bacterium]
MRASRVKRTIQGSVVLLAASLTFFGFWRVAIASDHFDPPERTDPRAGGMDQAADIADLFAWFHGSGADRKAVFALTFNGARPPSADQRVLCDPRVIYQILIDANGDADGVAPTITMEMRLGQDDRGNCFYRVTGVPGVSEAIVGPVEFTTQRGGVQVYVGLRADPFFFDLQGYEETIAMGTFRFNRMRDYFAGKNASAWVIELPLSRIGSPSYRVWATTSRLPMP